MKTIPAILFALLSTLHAAPVTWTTANVSASSDVLTTGTLIGAMNVGTNSSQAINGVNFVGDTGGAGFSDRARTVDAATTIAIADAGGVTIDATSLPGGLTIQRDSAILFLRLFSVASGTSLTLRGLTLANGSSGFFGGSAISNSGTLALTHCTLSGNSGSNGGGAIFNNSTLTLENTIAAGNTAPTSARMKPAPSPRTSTPTSGKPSPPPPPPRNTPPPLISMAMA
jgi:hypothetical protein